MTDIIVKGQTDISGEHDDIEKRRKQQIWDFLPERYQNRDFSKRIKENGRKGDPDFNIDIPQWLHDRFFKNFEGKYRHVPASTVFRIILASVSDKYIQQIYEEAEEIAVLKLRKKHEKEEEKKRLQEEKTTKQLQKELEEEKLKNEARQEEIRQLRERFEGLMKELGL
jgi:hypothetical protein